MTIFLGVAAVNTGNNLVYMIVALLLGTMAASGLFGKGNLSRVEMDLQFPREIYANRSFTLPVRLVNKRRFLPVFLMRVRLGTADTLFPFVDRGSHATVYVPFSFSRRGRQKIEDVYILSRFPFNFFVRALRLKKSFEVLVFPEPLKCDAASLYWEERGARGESSGGQRGDGAEFMSIRDYLPGDPVKYINWKASAKTGGLKTTELAASVRQPAIIDFDRVEIGNVEDKVSSIAFTVLQLLRQDVPVGFRIGEKVYKPDVSEAHKLRIMTELALYER